jgi:YaiO family outer membrane protein
MRYLDFTTSQTDIYTASLSKYWGNYLFTVRTYYVPATSGSSQSFGFVARRYFGGGQTYVGLTGGFGSASADLQFQQDIRRLNSQSISVEFQKTITNRLNIGGNAGWDSEEYPNFQRDRYSAKLYFSYRF